jgi:hypothetical protein
MIRKILGFIFTVISCFQAIAQTNSLVIVSESGNTFLLSVNNKIINQSPQIDVKAFDLSPGWQQLFITATITNKEVSLKDSFQIKDIEKFANKEITFALVVEKGKLKLHFKSISELSGPNTPPVPDAPKEVVPLVDNSIYGNLYQAKNNKPVFFTNYDKETSTCKHQLNEKELGYANRLLIKCNDEETKLRYLIEILDLNCYNTLQLKQLLELLPIEMDRLNCAKQAYKHLSDLQNINSLLPVFKYQTMKDSYSSYLKEQENITKQKKLNCNEPINATQFETLLAKIKNGGYENEKVLVAKKLLVDVCISTAQTKSIAQLFSHDRETLEFMKSAYNVLTDKVNAKDLVSEFQFNETKEEFLKYISK